MAMPRKRVLTLASRYPVVVLSEELSPDGCDVCHNYHIEDWMGSDPNFVVCAKHARQYDLAW